MATKEQIAWAAGLFEGEGCFTIATTTWPRNNGRVSYTKQIRSKINMTDEDVVRKFHAIVGIGSVVYVSPTSEKYLPQWQWYTGKVEEARYIYTLLREHLGKRRRMRAEELLRIMDEYKKKPYAKRGMYKE